MRMRFGHGDETAYQKRRHELREQFARWLIERAMPVDPSDADLLDAKEREEPPVGPVHLPAPAEQLAAIRASTAMQQLRSLAEHCTPPGRELTALGDLLRDTRFLAEAIGTDDGLETEVSIVELPGLDRLVHLGICARVVEPKDGRLVAVPAFAELDEVAAYQRVVTAAVAAGLSRLSSFGSLFEESYLVDRFVELMFAELLDAGPTGVTARRLIQLVERATMMEPDEAYEHSALPDCVDTQLENLEYLGVVAMPEPKRFVTLTPAGIPVAVALVEKAGTVVQVKPSPAAASAGEIVDLVGQIDPAAVDPTRIAVSWVDVLATSLDTGGAGDLIGAVGRDQQSLTAMLERVWRLDHPRLAEVLEVIGAQYPAKPVAKAARRALMKHRNR